ncbi:hypothetical protein AVEN_123574-1 [Araneus ventricosus]|uniref:Uncharacterized protein n=1 Tax=Araneus ventricosus TaxID=182803 RepID=A0A4Y2N2N8_ARAVE|nr:hypothetical protein AVEN_123574-1 [Araneus ventricosus]
MGFVISRFVIVIVLCFSISALLCLGRKKKSVNKALQACAHTQMCECGISQRFGDCYEYLTENSRRWLVDELNSCNLVELEYGQTAEAMQKLCSVDPDEFRPCFDETNSKLMKRTVAAATGIYGPDESSAFAKSRICIEAILAFCDSTSDMCMSISIPDNFRESCSSGIVPGCLETSDSQLLKVSKRGKVLAHFRTNVVSHHTACNHF